MKNTIKFAALGAAALAVSSTSALALSELPAGITTGIALGAPLPEGVYDISIGSYGSRNAVLGNLSYGLPVWLIWSTPWQIAGGRIAFDSTAAIADVWGNIGVPKAGITADSGMDSFLNTLVEGSIAWSLGNGWNASLRAGAWLPSEQTLVKAFDRDYTAFMGGGSVSYVAHGWNLTATALYGSGHDTNSTALLGLAQRLWVNLDITATKKFGKMKPALSLTVRGTSGLQEQPGEAVRVRYGRPRRLRLRFVHRTGQGDLRPRSQEHHRRFANRRDRRQERDPRYSDDH